MLNVRRCYKVLHIQPYFVTKNKFHVRTLFFIRATYALQFLHREPLDLKENSPFKDIKSASSLAENEGAKPAYFHPNSDSMQRIVGGLSCRLDKLHAQQTSRPKTADLYGRSGQTSCEVSFGGKFWRGRRYEACKDYGI